MSKEIVLDFGSFRTDKAAHEYIAEKLSFPEYYGKNADALYDCLSELSEPADIKIINCDMLDYSKNKIVNVFRDVEMESDRINLTIESWEDET